MKNILLSALALGTAIAGIILYYQKNNTSKNRISAAAEDAYQTMNEGIGSLERPMHHAMG